MDKISYWLYIEAFVFIFKGEKSRVVYNSFNSSYFQYKEYNIVRLLDKLLIPENGYCIPLYYNDLTDNFIRQFIKDIRDSDSGGLVTAKDITVPPFIFMPILRLENSVERIMADKGQSLGETILRNLSEITCFLPDDCSNNCENCDKYYKQFIHCCKFKNFSLEEADYRKLFHSFDACGLNKVNLVVNDINSKLLKSLIFDIENYEFNLHVYINILNVDKNIEQYLTAKIIFHFIIPPKFPNQIISNLKQRLSTINVFFVYIVESESDLAEVENCSCNLITPFYNGSNLSFFNDNIFLSLQDIISEPISKQIVFRRQVLNEIFFGKLFLFPSGDVYSNVNSKPLGNVLKHSLGELVYEELSDSKIWLLTRDKTECKNCPNHFLCPSISNYELVIGRTNLCHLSP